MRERWERSGWYWWRSHQRSKRYALCVIIPGQIMITVKPKTIMKKVNVLSCTSWSFGVEQRDFHLNAGQRSSFFQGVKPGSQTPNRSFLADASIQYYLQLNQCKCEFNLQEILIARHFFLDWWSITNITMTVEKNTLSAMWVPIVSINKS